MNFVPEVYGSDLLKFLSSRFHPGRPHIGVVGPLPPDMETEDPFDPSEQEVVSDTRQTASFKFVPYFAGYRLTMNDQKIPTTTRINFFLRTNEGSSEDVNPVDGRSNEYVLSEHLLSSFRKYEIMLETDDDGIGQKGSVTVDGKKFSIGDDSIKSKIKAKLERKPEESNLTVFISDESDPFLVSVGTKYAFAVQKYAIKIERTVRKLKNAFQVVVRVTNQSEAPDSRETHIPVREINDDNNLETESECKERYKLYDPESGHYEKWRPRLFNIINEKWRIHGNTFGSLLEFFMSEENIRSSQRPYSDEYDLEHVINVVYDDSDIHTDGNMYVGCMQYRDHLIFKEEIPPMMPGKKPSELFRDLGLTQKFAEILEQKGINPLHKFQEDSLVAIHEALEKGEDRAVLLSSRTAGGKTEAFMLRVIEYCIQKLNAGERGTKAIIFYPTKALANDQTSRIVELLYEINKNLGTKITIGLLHRDVPTSADDPEFQASEWEGVPIKCPECKEGYLSPKSSTESICSNCSNIVDFVILFQEPLYGLTPDILITNPDKLQYDMMLQPAHHGIFGREVTVCSRCSRSYAGMKRVCYCQNNKFVTHKPLPPKFVLFDEIHMFSGTFGINSSLFLSRLKSMIKYYARTYHDIQTYNIVTIGSSATISNAEYFSETFFTLPIDKIQIVPKDDITRRSYYLDVAEAKRTNRVHVFLMPYAYRPAATVAKIVGYLQLRRLLGDPPDPFEERRETSDLPLQTLGFVNSLSDSTNLIGVTKREMFKVANSVRVDGHTTDFDKSQRGKAERDFNKNELHVLYATPTLEVGVDFRTVDCVLIFGFPFSFNEYVQRIGRGGRKGDTLVITLCQHWKPIDHYFYSDAKRKISMQHNYLEPIPITKNNPDAMERHLRATVLESICCWRDSNKLLEDVRELEPELEARKAALAEESMKRLSLTEEQKLQYADSIREFLQKFSEHLNTIKQMSQKLSMAQLFHDKIRGLKKIYRLDDLRSTESQVTVEVIWESMKN